MPNHFVFTIPTPSSSMLQVVKTVILYFICKVFLMFHCILSFKYFKKYSQLKIHLKALQILIKHKITQCLLAKIKLWMFLYELESTWLPGIRNTFIALNHSTFFQLLLCIRYSASYQGMWWWVNETQLLTLSTASIAQCEAFHEEGTNKLMTK